MSLRELGGRIPLVGSDACAVARVYDPHVAFRGALEVNRGAFGRWGVRRGALVTIRR